MSAAADTGRAALLGNLASLAVLAALAIASAWLQDGTWWLASPRRAHWIGGAAVLLAYIAWLAWHLWRTRPRVADAAAVADDTWLVVHASQTGFAEALAMRTAGSLCEAGLDARVRAIAELDAATLQRTRRLLLVASTTGEGDPPDPALRFVRDVMSIRPDLSQLGYAVLALGDRSYDDVCAFGHALDRWLRASAATPLCDLVEVDNGDAGALRLWQHHLSLLSDRPDLADWSAPTYAAWTLADRTLANPGSAGDPAFDLTLVPAAGADTLRGDDWTAGDIAEIGPRHADATINAWLSRASLDGAAEVTLADDTRGTLREALAAARLPDAADSASRSPQAIVDALEALPHREYSIASLPSEGALRLLVRRMARPDGTPGLGSGWLCEGAAPGAAIALRVRRNANFHPPAVGTPLVLVGNGTGIAGLRAHIAARAAAGATRTWLLFGERNAAHDAFFDDDLARWLAVGVLERLDRTWSRDGGPMRYVQDLLVANADALRDWIDAGAAIYVCGSLQGMAPGVDTVLRTVLGDARVDALMADGRYRRDVY